MPPYAEQAGKSAAETAVEKLQPEIKKLLDLLEDFKQKPKVKIDLKQLTPWEEMGKISGVVATTAVQKAPLGVNYAILFCSMRTAGRSALGILYTSDPIAQAFFAVGLGCSSLAASSTGYACWIQQCQLRYKALTMEVVGEAFYRLGLEANHLALLKQGKLEEAAKLHQRKSMFTGRPWNNGKSTFTAPYLGVAGAAIPYRKIYKVTAGILLIYGYSKYVITFSRYAQQMISRFKKRRASKRLLEEARFLVTCVKVRRTERIKRLALSSSSYTF